MLVLRRLSPLGADPVVARPLEVAPRAAARHELRGPRPLRRGNDAFVATGPLAALVAIAVSVTVGSGPWSSSVPSWSVAVALGALLLGIPHGAVDHLTIAPTSLVPRLRWTVGYLSLAAAAVALLLLAPGPSFLAVVAMSVWHFGSGDVEARLDLGRQSRAQTRTGRRLLAAVAFGSAPLILPLTSSASLAAVGQVDPALAVLWSPAFTGPLHLAVLAVVAAAMVSSLRAGDRRGALELLVLTGLGLLATPLLAFATYFACWHALRHTARLAQTAPGADVTRRQLTAVFLAGLPALMVTVGAIAAVAALPGRSSLLGAGLVVVWGLTVPHMFAVGGLDRRRRRQRAAPTLLSAPTTGRGLGT